MADERLRRMERAAAIGGPEETVRLQNYLVLHGQGVRLWLTMKMQCHGYGEVRHLLCPWVSRRTKRDGVVAVKGVRNVRALCNDPSILPGQPTGHMSEDMEYILPSAAAIEEWENRVKEMRGPIPLVLERLEVIYPPVDVKPGPAILGVTPKQVTRSRTAKPSFRLIGHGEWVDLNRTELCKCCWKILDDASEFEWGDLWIKQCCVGQVTGFPYPARDGRGS